MIANYFKIFLRNLWRNRVYALINVLGLGIALSVCIVAYFNFRFGYDFDRQHEHLEKIFRINVLRDMQGRQQEYGLCPNSLPALAGEEIQEMEQIARIQRAYISVKVREHIFNRSVSFVDPAFLDIFTFSMVTGSPENLEDPNHVLLSRKMAGELFGDASPVGKEILLFNDSGKEFSFLVAGVFEDLPMNSSFWIDVLASYESFLSMWEIDDDSWKRFTTAVFCTLHNPGTATVVEEKLDKYLPVQNMAREDFTITGFRMIPLDDVGDNTRDIWSGGLYPGLHPAAVMAPPIMALLIFLIACFNFTNTAIAASGRRLKEIGLRKMVGAQKIQVVLQFILENQFVTLLALLAGLGFAWYLVPAYSSLWEYMDIRLSFTGHISFWIFLLGMLLLTGIMAGAYPAFYISRFKPISIFQEKVRLGGENLFSKILLGLQFAISFMALSSGVIFSSNATYQETLDLGYDKDLVIAVPTVNQANLVRLRNELARNPDVRMMGETEEHIGWGAYKKTLVNEEYRIESDMMDVGENYQQAMGLRLLEGRFFEPERKEYDRGNGSIVINKKLMDDFGWKNAVGQRLVMDDTVMLNVIGVVENFYTRGLWQEIEPLAMKVGVDEQMRLLAVKTEADRLSDLQESIRASWLSLVPNYPYEGFFQEDTMEEERTINDSIKKVYLFLALVAVLLSLIGLYTLVSLSTLNRTKEIGVRKVMGAAVPSIMYLIQKVFLFILVIAAILGSFGAAYSCRGIMSSIWTYHLDPGLGLFLIPALGMILLSMLIIAGKVYQAASLNPVSSLRYE